MIDLKRLYDSMPPDLQRRVSCHDLKRTVDNYNQSMSGWNTDEPPKDGTKIVAIGVMTDDCGDGCFNSEPFTDTIQWEGEDWINEYGMSIAMQMDCEITIRCWLPFPQNTSGEARRDGGPLPSQP